MFRNKPVGKKIGNGYALVILIMAALMAINIVMLLTISGDMRSVDSLSVLQSRANSLKDTFNNAADAAGVVFDELNSDTAYNECVSYMDEALAQLDGMGEIASGIPKYAEINTLLSSEIEEWHGLVTAVNESNHVMEEKQNVLIESSRALDAASDELFESVSALTMQLSEEGDTSTTVYRIENVILPSVYMSSTVDDMRMASTSLLLSFDTSNVETIKGHIATIDGMAETLYNVVTTNEAKELISGMQQHLDEYEFALDEFMTALYAVDADVSGANSLMQTIISQIGEGTASIDADVALYIDNTTRTVWMTIIIIAAASVAVVLIAVRVSAVLGKSITVPLEKMKDVVVQVGESGNMNFTDEQKSDLNKEALAKDELGESLSAFSAMMKRLQYISKSLETIANGDLRVNVDLLSEHDIMGLSLKKMSDNLNHIFSELNVSSQQVAIGADGVSNGAQLLAQGSTEQAATVQQINSSISEINTQSRTSYDAALAASEKSGQISKTAHDGNTKMQNLTTAMREINDASAAIGQVIKVIEDIAFQTNILALNAAVEAARAGSHGKGFAVVAEEVRNLASKSADAAKKTSELISANIEKAGYGLGISEETATTLNKIVDGIRETNDALLEIVKQSEITSAATGEVNTAIQQVAQVVQQNSATSQESAAASEQISSQAQLLKQMISRFKLKDIDASSPPPQQQPTEEMAEEASAEEDTDKY